MFSRTDRIALLEVLIALAYADGDFADVERERITGLIEFFNLKAEARARIERLMEDPPKELPTIATMPSYHTRRYVFAQAVLLAYEDGVIHHGEREMLERLGVSLELAQADTDLAWRRGQEMAPQS